MSRAGYTLRGMKVVSGWLTQSKDHSTVNYRLQELVDQGYEPYGQHTLRENGTECYFSQVMVKLEKIPQKTIFSKLMSSYPTDMS
jgi:hypothetical protein